MSTIEPPHEPNAVAGSWSASADELYCYLTTTGRVTGKPRRIEIWFAVDAERGRLYMLSGGGDRSDWVKNLRRDPAVEVEIGPDTFAGRARVVTDPSEAERARTLVHDKYAPGYPEDLTSWRRTSLPVAVDLEPVAGNR
jgi:deazaflavin-dependent oxidoreductase (nitroreductase family)